MKDASEYLAFVGSLILLEDAVVHWQVVREEAQAQIGMLRYRLTLQNQELLEVFESFTIVQSQISVTKYSYHWQDASGNLVKRWDNAPHHPTISTYPHHLHDGSEDQVVSQGQVTILDVFATIRQTLGGK